VGRLGDEVSRLKQEIDAMGSPRMPAWGHWSEEREREFHQLFERWWNGADLSDKELVDVASLDEYGPIAIAVCDENFDVNGTVDEYAETYLTPRAAQARRRRMEQREA
jgi:hypothetical protein